MEVVEIANGVQLVFKPSSSSFVSFKEEKVVCGGGGGGVGGGTERKGWGAEERGRERASERERGNEMNSVCVCVILWCVLCVCDFLWCVFVCM